MKTVLTIAGTDPSGGAGLHADLKTFAAHKVYGMGVVTAIVAQNTCGVFSVEQVTPAMIEAQLEAVFSDIFPDAVKIGMLRDCASIRVVSAVLRRYRPRFVILDPVMVSTSGHRLLESDAESCLKEEFLPLATLVTPNIPEAEALCGFEINGPLDMERAARAVAAMGSHAVLLKGGHLRGDCNDFLLECDFTQWYRSPRVDTKNTHGTGCTLSAAIAANLAEGFDLRDAVARGKEYVVGALSQGLSLGKGSGPLDHSWLMEKMDFTR